MEQDQWERRMNEMAKIQERLEEARKYRWGEVLRLREEAEAMSPDTVKRAVRTLMDPESHFWRVVHDLIRFNEHAMVLLTDLDYRKVDKEEPPVRPRKPRCRA